MSVVLGVVFNVVAIALTDWPSLRLLRRTSIPPYVLLCRVPLRCCATRRTSSHPADFHLLAHGATRQAATMAQVFKGQSAVQVRLGCGGGGSEGGGGWRGAAVTLRWLRPWEAQDGVGSVSCDALVTPGLLPAGRQANGAGGQRRQRRGQLGDPRAAAVADL